MSPAPSPVAATPPVPAGGAPQSSFTAVPSASSMPGLTSYTIKTNLTASVPGEFFTLRYGEGPSSIEALPMRTGVDTFLAYAPLGLLAESGAPTSGRIPVVLTRVLDGTILAAPAFVLDIRPPTDELPVPAIAGVHTLLGALNKQQQALATRAAPGTTLASTMDAVLNPGVARVFNELDMDLQEERLLRIYLAALFAELGVDIRKYVRPRTAALPSGSGLAAPMTLDDTLQQFSVDFDTLLQDLGDRVRENSSRLATVGTLVGIAGATVLSGTALAPAAVGIGATMGLVAMGTALTNGFLLDNATILGGLNTTDQLRWKDTATYWLDRVQGRTLRDLRERYFPVVDVTTNPIKHLAAYYAELRATDVLDRSRGLAIDAFGSGRNLDLREAWGTIASPVSSAWTRWRAQNFSAQAFPASDYQRIWSGASVASPPAPSPTPGVPAAPPQTPPSRPPGPICSDCARSN